MFSIVIPAYNAEKTIKASVNSVLNQSNNDFEIIIIDDGSVDKTKDVIADYDDNRIRYIYQENSGVSAARNRGIKESKGEFVCFLDADDEWKKDHLDVLSNLSETYKNCGMYITGYDICLNNGKIIHKSAEILKNIPDEHFMTENAFDVLIKNGYFFNTNTMCCRREVFDRVGIFEVGVKNGEDDDMWYRIFSYYNVAISKKSTTVYNRANAGATKERMNVIKPFFLNRIEKIMSEKDIPCERKKSLLVWVERNKLSRARQHILLREKKEAFSLLKEISFKKSNKKKYFTTILCMIIPSKITRWLIDKRDVGYYQ